MSRTIFIPNAGPGFESQSNLYTGVVPAYGASRESLDVRKNVGDPLSYLYQVPQDNTSLSWSFYDEVSPCGQANAYRVMVGNLNLFQLVNCVPTLLLSTSTKVRFDRRANISSSALIAAVRLPSDKFLFGPEALRSVPPRL